MGWTRGKTHKDVDFAVQDHLHGGGEKIFKTFAEAAAFAVNLAQSGRTVNLDVLIHSEKGARWYGGPDGVRDYKEDEDASVFERIEITANSAGRIY